MKAVVLLSGGLDSYTAAAVAKRDGYELSALTVRYGQVHALEIASARTVAHALNVSRHVELDVNLAAFGGSSPHGNRLPTSPPRAANSHSASVGRRLPAQRA